MRTGDALDILPTLAEASVDFVATDPPYNIQLPLTMAGGKLAETRQPPYRLRDDQRRAGRPRQRRRLRRVPRGDGPGVP